MDDKNKQAPSEGPYKSTADFVKPLASVLGKAEYEDVKSRTKIDSPAKLYRELSRRGGEYADRRTNIHSALMANKLRDTPFDGWGGYTT